MEQTVCQACERRILWAEVRGKWWLPLNATPVRGTGLAFLPIPGRKIALALPEISFRDIHPSLRARIPQDMVEFWRTTLNGPRYETHPRACAFDVATSIDYLANREVRRLLDRLNINEGFSMAVEDDDCHYYD